MLRSSLLIVTGLLILPLLLWFVAPDSASELEPTPAPESTEEVAVLDLELVEIEGDGFVSLAPEGWRDVGDGVHIIDGTEIALVQRLIAAPGLRWVQPGVKDEMLFTEYSDDFIEHETEHYTWRIYSGKTDEFDVSYALADGNFFEVHMVLMQVPSADHDAYYEQMFLPVLNAYQGD